MSRLTFEISGVKKLLKEIQSAEQFLATVDQLFEPTNYPGGVPLNEAGKTEKEACLAGEVFWPSPKHMVQTRLTPQITLVKGHGVCLITNASLDGSPVSRDTAIYARGGLAPIFPYTFYHLTHYWFAAADIPVANDTPVHYADAIRCNVRRPPQGSLPLLTRRVSA